MRLKGKAWVRGESFGVVSRIRDRSILRRPTGVVVLRDEAPASEGMPLCDFLGLADGEAMGLEQPLPIVLPSSSAWAVQNFIGEPENSQYRKCSIRGMQGGRLARLSVGSKEEESGHCDGYHPQPLILGLQLLHVRPLAQAFRLQPGMQYETIIIGSDHFLGISANWLASRLHPRIVMDVADQ